MTLKLDDWITQLVDLFVAADIFGPSCAHVPSAQYCDLIYIYTIPILSLLKFEACQKGSTAWGGVSPRSNHRQKARVAQWMNTGERQPR
jgi:hypothetical protein